MKIFRDDSQKRKFRGAESKIKYFFWAMASLATGIIIIGLWNSIHDSEIFKRLLIIKDYFQIFSLLISGLVLLYLLFKMYREDYEL